jgi:hypothetical protein
MRKLSLSLLTAFCGLALTSPALAQTVVTLGTITSEEAQLDAAMVPVASRLVFTRDYVVVAEDDNAITPICHMEPANPLGGAVTKAGTVLVVNDVQEVMDDGEEIVAISGNSAAGDSFFMIHCEHGRETIGNLLKALSERFGIEMSMPGPLKTR